MPVSGLEPDVMPTAEVSSTDLWWGEKDSNLRPYAYEAYELTSCSIPPDGWLDAPSMRVKCNRPLSFPTNGLVGQRNANIYCLQGETKSHGVEHTLTQRLIV